MACPYIGQGKNIKLNRIGWKINKNLDFLSCNAICCKKDNCIQVYIGESKLTLKCQLYDHCVYINIKNDNATGSHLNLAIVLLNKQ